MQKLLYIAPHLSTGGLPQYLTKKIELLKDTYEIYLVEWSDVTGGVLVVTRNKILNLIDSDKFFTLGEDKNELIDIINRVKPDIVHSEEIPEFYMDFNVATKLYSSDRKYKIVETSHDSSFDTTQKKFFPDKFMFVSQWQIDQYKDINIPKVLVEYPIEYSNRPNREEALNKLGLDPNKKHVLHIGLFTPRKNQAEFFEYAKALPQYEFHCVGNQADNFKWYWEPLMENKPDNVTWWNERTDVDSFYQAMDLFLFTSRGTNTDKETMPLVIREAISYQIPILIYNLEVYQNYFDKFNGINYLDFSDFSYNCSLIESTLYLNDSDAVSKEAYIVGTYPNSSIIEKITVECLKSLRKDNRIIITTSHCPVSKEIQELSDYVIYDKNNITTQHTFEWWWFAEGPGYKIKAKAAHNKEDNFYHGPACHNNIHNAMALALNLGIEKTYLINYDYHLKNVAPINYISEILDTHSLYSEIVPFDSGDGPQMRTAFMAIKPKTFLNYLPQIFTQEDWDNLQVLKEANSNGLETLWYSFLKDDPKAYWEDSDKFKTVWEEALHPVNFSQAEYFIPLPVHEKDNEYAIIIRTSNDVDSRKFVVRQLDVEGNIIWENPLNVTKKLIYWKVTPFDLTKDNSTIYQLEQRDLETDNFISIKEIKIDNEYLQNNLYENGHIILP
jgi:glycosyltransferase involved in cell wall biosynthesis